MDDLKEYLSIKPSYSVSYYRRGDGPKYYGSYDARDVGPFCNIRHNAPKGIVTKRAGVKLRHAVQWMLLVSKIKKVYSVKTKSWYSYRLAFITVTLSEKQKDEHGDDYIKQHLLRPLLKWLEREGCKLWVWKAETQKNGNIHFHITVDGFIHWQSLRKKWNDIQYKNGYRRAYEGVNGANSTDIHAVRNTKAIGSYIEKYLCKSQTDRRLVNGRLWGCSTVLSRMKVRFSGGEGVHWQVHKFITDHSEERKFEYFRVWIHKAKVFHHPALRASLAALRSKACKVSEFNLE